MAKVAITEQYLTDIADAIRSKTGMSTATYLPSQMASAIMTISGGGGITPTGTLSIIENGTYNVTAYASASVAVPTGSTINNQNKTVNPSTSQQEITADSGYTGLGTVTVTAILAGTAGAPTATKGTVSNHSIAVTPSVINSTGYITGGTKTGTAVTVSASELVSGTKSISANGTNIDVTNYAKVDVAVPTSGSPVINSLSVTPTESEQTYSSSSVDGYKPVVVGAISSTYVGSGIDRNDSTDLSASGATVSVPAGYYAEAASKSVTTMTLPTSAAANATSGYTSKATISRSTSDQYINIAPGYNSAGGYYKISAVANGSATGPSSVSASSATITTGTNTITLTKTSVSTTPTVSAGYVSSATASTATVTLTASVTVNPTPTASGKTVTIPAGYYSAQTTKDVDTMTLPTSASASAASGYTSKATISRSTSDQYINIAPGYNTAGGYYKISAVANGSATAPSTISGTSATVSTGTNTLTLTKTVSVTPTVSAGYVSSGTAGNSSVSLTASVTTKGATTYHPSTTAQSISSGTYLTGTQTINAVTTSNLTADNIKSGVTVKIGDSSDDDCVASILGTYTGGSGASNIVQGSFTATSTSGGTTTVTVPYTGSGYPIAFIISLDGGSTYDTTTKRYAITAGYGVKRLTANAMTYDKTASNDGFSVQCIYKGSSGTSFSSGGSASVTIGNQDAPSASTSLWVSIHSKTDFRFFTMVSSYGLYPGKKYNYTIIYSS